MTVEFWGSAVGYDKTVALFNKTHKDIKIKYTQVPAGSAGGYSKMLNAVKAGNAPCLGQVGYDTLPSFAASGAVEDISQYAGSSKDKFVPWAWQMSSLGGKVLGVPIDLGPEAMFYRADLFKKYKIKPPTTWNEFAAAAEKAHAASPDTYLTTLPQDAYDLGALTWQAGGKWFGTANDRWQVTIDSPATQKVARYWQGLLDKKQVLSEPTFDTAWYKDIQDGHVLSYIGAVWAAPLIEQNAPGAAGKWSVAPLPQWTAGQQASGNRGGSATVVLKGCKNARQATEAALWMSTNADGVTSLIKNTGIYPAATSGQELPAVNQPSKYFGGQNIYQVFKAAAAHTTANWVWGPTMTQVQPDFKDGLKQVGAGQGTIPKLVGSVQANTVKAMKSQGLGVSG
ncbi:extracellular solute-binding protein [Streptomyces sp. Li-HN-5-11]|uniref:extracellular solute-binding protein n=1 Tax=Streptomyces sp. Li-HN-5-11 TaxID=3075432 RepID=UPI0028AF0D3F|nr:extracellular solute-binding protein [Streptomyces sp. Li-HN-5-11]WNM31976.1 extracellular solute-binding protein [Streptomyces sp. Li-HN-5-11]